METVPAGRRNRVDSLIERANARSALRFSNNVGIDNTGNKETGRDRRGLLDSLLNTTVSSPQRRKGRPFRSDEPLKNGWYEVGWKERKVYKSSELVMFWRILWKRQFPQVPPPAYSPYLKQHLLKWLQEDGYKLVETIFEYAFSHWEILKVRYSIEADGPELRVVYGFRKAIYSEMQRSKGRCERSINSRWEGQNNADEQADADTDAEFFAI